jgi:hypothetical protein
LQREPLISRDADRWARGRPVDERLAAQQEERDSGPGLVAVRTARALRGEAPVHPGLLFPHGRRAAGRRYEHYESDVPRDERTTFTKDELLRDYGPLQWQTPPACPFTLEQLKPLAKYVVQSLLPRARRRTGRGTRARRRRERVDAIFAAQPRGCSVSLEAHRRREQAKEIRAKLVYGLLSFYGANPDDVSALLGVGRDRVRGLEELGRRLCEAERGGQKLDAATEAQVALAIDAAERDEAEVA